MAEAKPFECIIEFEPYYMENDKHEMCFKSKSVQKLIRCRDCMHNCDKAFNHGIQNDPKCYFTSYHLHLDDFCSRAKADE